ncbi:MAG: hypothetical protein EXX96DRAFT_586227 [Benjaminiella poitrasii]|nr:MAG: hypothetical protein EXX96DRAFT_586227 [Benjaminiella poitrasii]
MISLMIDYLLPEKFVPRSDLISKTVLIGDRIINIICKSLNNSRQDNYMATLSESLNKSACDGLYLPKVDLSEYLPIIVEVQDNVNEKYMSRVACYSTLGYEECSIYPITLIISVSTVTTSVTSKLDPVMSYSYK